MPHSCPAPPTHGCPSTHDAVVRDLCNSAPPIPTPSVPRHTSNPNPARRPRRYVFCNPHPECVLRKGRRHCLVLKPAVSRIDESEDLAEVAREYETQLAANRGLNESERAGLRGKLDKINSRLGKLGARVVRSMSGSFGRR